MTQDPDSDQSVPRRDGNPPTVRFDLFDEGETVASKPGNWGREASECDKPAFPDQIGQYRILDVLGEGGMGLVYKAVQPETQRHIALKTLKGGLSSKSAQKRFHHEVQILANLHHPSIAEIYEAGQALVGGVEVSYFAMEYLDGHELDVYAEEHQLDIPQRLELVARVCDGVRHAHQKGVIHRDLKPANILVVDDEGTYDDSSTGNRQLADPAARPKILDFGIAHINDADTKLTGDGQLLGTVAFMSPEQAAGNTSQVDTRSDVYAVGVMLYLLLTREMPYNLDGLGVAALNVIMSKVPPRIGGINPECAGDLELIVAKALEKDPDRRYAAVADLGADIRHFLLDEPIQARPPSAFYQLKMFARRNKGLVLSLLVMMMLLLAGVVGTGLGLVEARKAGELARSEAEAAKLAQLEADRVADFLVGLFTESDPFHITDQMVSMGQVTVNDLLASGTERIQNDLRDQPAVRARLLNTLGRVYSSMDRYDQARPLLEEAVALSRDHYGERHPDTIRGERDLGRLLENLTNYRAAEHYYKASLRNASAFYGEDHEETILSAQAVAKLYLTMGDRGRAEPLLIENITRAKRVLGSQHPVVANGVNALAWSFYVRGDLVGAEGYFREAVAMAKADYGRTTKAARRESVNPNLAITFNNLAWVLVLQDKVYEGEATILSALEWFGKALSPDHWRIANASSILGAVRARQGRYAEAEALLLAAYPKVRAGTGDTSPYTRVLLERLIDLYQRTGEVEKQARFQAIYQRKR